MSKAGKQQEELLDKLLLDALIREDETKEEEFPEKTSVLPLFPLNRRPLFPGIAAPISIEGGPYKDFLKSAQENPGYVILLMTKEEGANTIDTTPKDWHTHGVLAKILRVISSDRGAIHAVIRVKQRVEVLDVQHSSADLWFSTHFELNEDPVEEKDEDIIKAYSMSILTTIKEILPLNTMFKEEFELFIHQSTNTSPERLADYAISFSSASRDELQEIIATGNHVQRLEKSLIVMRKELELAQLQHDLTKKVDESVNKTQKEYYLREQLKTIRKELGIERDEKNLELEKFEKRLLARTVPDAIKQIIVEEMQKFASFEHQSGEYSICRNYVDWLTIVPWGIYAQNLPSMDSSKQILEEDHYGIQEIKERILELVAVTRIVQAPRGQILCFVGPPGVGKTSIGKSIARALGRKFYRFSVGGMHDEAEIKGHRRTYVGAMPGKLIRALKMTETMNPVIMIDEVDKMVQSHRGDPASALLEVLDPEQNNEFMDHYLDVPCDLSQVLFILTANVVDTIPHALRDRLEIIRLSGYDTHEKIEIVKRHLMPKLMEEIGLKKTNLSVSDSVLKQIIDKYARESGVRGLEKCLKKILRKRAIELVRDEEALQAETGAELGAPIKIDGRKRRTVKADELKQLLGEPKFHSDQIYSTTPVGVSTGLAWTAMGGVTLYIECVKTPSEKSELKLTGQAGAVMKESSEIAWTFLKSYAAKKFPDRSFFEKNLVHMHIPEGATPKDGPSAGITMATALLSLLIEEPINSNLAMTGEVTLTGKVLPIGGVKEKVLAAKRSGISELIFPVANQRDCEELSDELKEKMSFHYVSHFEEILPHAFKKV